jgi:hypothetical protein
LSQKIEEIASLHYVPLAKTNKGVSQKIEEIASLHCVPLARTNRE